MDGTNINPQTTPRKPKDRSGRSARVQCKAKAHRTGERCRRYSIKGGVVCLTHGGRAPQVRRAAQERLADLIDPDRMLREAAHLATSDLLDYYDEDWNLKPKSEWTPKMRAAAKQVEPVMRDITPGERGPQEMVRKLVLHDKSKNIELLFRHLGMLEKDKSQVNVQVAVVDRLLAARNRLVEGGSGQ